MINSQYKDFSWKKYTKYENQLFENCDITNTVFENAAFKNVTFNNCLFSQCNTTNIGLWSSAFVNCTLIRVDLRNMPMGADGGDLKTACFRDATLEGSIFGIRSLKNVFLKTVN